MSIVDAFIILFATIALMRGSGLGLVRQAGSTTGFVAGLFIGSWVGAILIGHLSTSVNKALIGLVVTLAGGFACMSVGELFGIDAKAKIMRNYRLNSFDSFFGSIMGLITILFAIWLGAAILALGPSGSLQQALKNSRILAALNSDLPPATSVLGSLNKLIDPNGFPQVFTGLEPQPSTAPVTLPNLGAFSSVVKAAEASVVKIEGSGCGGIVEGSGFIVDSQDVATNAHVVAGVASPKVLEGNAIHDTRVVWFDPNIDLAVLRVRGLTGSPLTVDSTDQPGTTPGVTLGYPGGGGFDAQPAVITQRFTAVGRNIYGQGNTARDVYALQAHIVPGNSGGPLIGANGHVLGIVFATSTTYNNVGYALTGHEVAAELARAERSNTTYSTGACSE